MMSEKCGTNKEFSPNAIRALKSYNWPGNIRELENTVERLFVMVDENVIRKKNLPDEILQVISIKDAISDLPFFGFYGPWWQQNVLEIHSR